MPPTERVVGNTLHALFANDAKTTVLLCASAERPEIRNRHLQK